MPCCVDKRLHGCCVVPAGMSASEAQPVIAALRWVCMYVLLHRIGANFRLSCLFKLVICAHVMAVVAPGMQCQCTHPVPLCYFNWQHATQGQSCGAKLLWLFEKWSLSGCFTACRQLTALESLTCHGNGSRSINSLLPALSGEWALTGSSYLCALGFTLLEQSEYMKRRQEHPPWSGWVLGSQIRVLGFWSVTQAQLPQQEWQE